jgi:hypothetical protein
MKGFTIKKAQAFAVFLFSNQSHSNWIYRNKTSLQDQLNFHRAHLIKSAKHLELERINMPPSFA